jgi:hypothetical protein
MFSDAFSTLPIDCESSPMSMYLSEIAIGYWISLLWFPVSWEVPYLSNSAGNRNKMCSNTFWWQSIV